MLHSGCVKLHQKFRDFVGLPMGLLREESPKNRMNTGLFGSRSGNTVSKQREELHSSQRDNFCLRTILYDLQLPRIEILGSFFGVL